MRGWRVAAAHPRALGASHETAPTAALGKVCSTNKILTYSTTLLLLLLIK